MCGIMLNLSITSLDTDHIDEICEDVIAQQREGISTHAMFMMKFNPEGTPPIDKGEIECKKYDLFREKLDKAGAKHGVLVQATLGHISKPYEPYPFQPSVSLVTGEERDVTCCPLDPNTREYMKAQMCTLAKRKPSIIMIDDDMGLLYKPTKGCACKYHMAEFNRRAGTNMSREELYAHTQGTSEEARKYTDIYVDVQRDGLVGMAQAMREGIDEIDPTIQGAVSGIYVNTFCEFSGDIAKAFAGKNNPAIVRMNGGPYSLGENTKGFTINMFRAAILKENIKDKADIFLAETDPCPHNRYSTSAALMHAHFTAIILEGATGAKHWITRLQAFEPNSGKAYRKILSKYHGFYEKLTEYAKELRPFGCRIPVTLMQNYGFVPETQGLNLSPWATCVLERLGLPMYFGNQGEGAVFLDDFSTDGFSDEEIKKFLSGTIVLSVGAAKKLADRGFMDYIGVEVHPWEGKTVSNETVNGIRLPAQYNYQELKICRDGVMSLSDVCHNNVKEGRFETLFPGVTYFKNPLGGETIVFSGTPDMPFAYFTAFSLLNETRKNQLVELVSKRNRLSVYYPGDIDMYVKAGTLSNGEIMVSLFNLSHDELDEIPVVISDKFTKIEKLNCDGTRSECTFDICGNDVIVHEVSKPLIPVVLFIS